MQASYEVTEKDLLEAQTSHAGILFRVGQFMGVFSIAVGLGGMFLAAAPYAGLVVSIVVGLVLLFRLRLSAKLSFKRDFDGLGQVDIAVSQPGIQFQSAKGTGDFKWTAFIRYKETKHLFMLYPQSRLFNIVPKRALAPPDLLEFRQILQQNLGEKSASYNKKISPALIVFLAIVIITAILLGLVLVGSNG